MCHQVKLEDIKDDTLINIHHNIKWYSMFNKLNYEYTHRLEDSGMRENRKTEQSMSHFQQYRHKRAEIYAKDK